MRRDVDDAVRRIARYQRGVFSLRQALAAGATYQLVRRRLDAGHWLKVDHDVFGLPGIEMTWEQRAMAASIGAPNGAISGPAAAAIHQLRGFRPGPLELTVPART